MTTHQLRLRRPVHTPGLAVPPGTMTILVAIVGAALAAWIAVSRPEWHRAALAIGLAVNLIVVGIKWPRAATIATLLFLPFLALVRRLLIEGSGWSTNDPLLLVAPVVAAFLVFRLYVLERRPIFTDGLSKLVAALLAIAVLQAFNPIGVGGVAAGLAGLLFVAVPLLWFFVGRELASTQVMSALIYSVIGLAVLIGLYGMWQTELGTLPSWDNTWYESFGYTALKIGEKLDEVRPWGTFSSSSEYGSYLSIALLFIWAMCLHLRFAPVVATIALLPAVFYAGGRAVLVLMLIAGLIMLAARVRNLAAGIAILAVGLAGTYGLAATVGPTLDQAAGLSGNAVAERNVGGFLNPLDPSQSTLLTHWEAMGEGIVAGFQNPAGQGAGATNLAVERVADETVVETDNDIADIFVSFGAIGGCIFLAVIFLGLRTVFRRYSQQGSWQLLAVAGLLVATLGFWLNGGHYAVAPLVWFCLGWATRSLPDPEPDGSPVG